MQTGHESLQWINEITEYDLEIIIKFVSAAANSKVFDVKMS